MTTEGCSSASCPTEEELHLWRGVAIAVIILVFLVGWFILCWRPVLPEAEWAIAHIMTGIVSLWSCFMCFNNTSEEGNFAQVYNSFKTAILAPIYWLIDKAKSADAWWQENNGRQILKIYITFLQILSSFDMFAVQWPPAFITAINWVRGTVKFDIVRLPGISCLWNGVSWHATLLAYTLGPLGLFVALAIPVLTAWVRGFQNTDIKRWREAVDRFWKILMLVLFIIYPALAMQSLSVLNCDMDVGRLKDDYRVVCPHLLSFESIYSHVCMALYPIGIPVLMHLALRQIGIVKVVQEKIQAAQFHAMLSLFMQVCISTELQRFSWLVGNVNRESHEIEFKRQCKYQFNMLLALQEGGGEDIDLAKLKSAAQKEVREAQNQQRKQSESHKVHDWHLFSKWDSKIFAQVDTDQSGSISIDELRAFMQHTNPEVSEEEVQERFKRMDRNHDGDVSTAEFLADKEYSAELTFLQIDTDHSGNINIDEVRACMQNINPEVTEEEVQEQFKLMDKNHDGAVSKAEFLGDMDSFDAASCDAKDDTLPVTIGTVSEQAGKFREGNWSSKGFERFDANGDGVIDLEEFEAMLDAARENAANNGDFEKKLECFTLEKRLDVARRQAVISQSMQGASLAGICKCLEEFDANGDGVISLEEFEAMIKATKKKANLFTGSEDPHCLSYLQSQTLLLFEWPTRQGGPRDADEKGGMDGLMVLVDSNNKVQDDEEEQAAKAEERDERQQNVQTGDTTDPELIKIHVLEVEFQKRLDDGRMSKVYFQTACADIMEAKKIYVDKPDDLDAFLKLIKIKALPRDELHRSVLELAHRLVNEEVISIPIQIWHKKTPSDDDAEIEEQHIINRFGFLILAYRVEFWWFEAVEMFRKLLMTSILVFIKPGTPGQLASGAMITFVFLIIGHVYRPFCSSRLNSLNVIALTAQFCTLFIGIMICLLDVNQSKGGASDLVDRSIISIMILLVNGVSIFFPLLQTVRSGSLSDCYESLVGVYKRCCSLSARWCASKKQRAKYAASDAKKKERQKAADARNKKREKENLKRAKDAYNAEAATKAAAPDISIMVDAGHSHHPERIGRDCEPAGIIPLETPRPLMRHESPTQSFETSPLEHAGDGAKYLVEDDVKLDDVKNDVKDESNDTGDKAGCDKGGEASGLTPHAAPPAGDSTSASSGDSGRASASVSASVSASEQRGALIAEQKRLARERGRQIALEKRAAKKAAATASRPPAVGRVESESTDITTVHIGGKPELGALKPMPPPIKQPEPTMPNAMPLLLPGSCCDVMLSLDPVHSCEGEDGELTSTLFVRVHQGIHEKIIIITEQNGINNSSPKT